MAISDTIQSMYANVENAYTSLEAKGATVSGNKNLANLASSIDSIPAGSGVEVVKGLADGTLTEFKASDYGVTSLTNQRFYQFTNLESLDLTGVTSIPSSTAYGCTSLKNLTLSANSLSIGSSAFSYCTNVSNFNLDTSTNITSLGSSAFYQFGYKRQNPSSNKLVFDFRNSSFSSVDYSTWSGGSSGVDYLTYIDVYFPSTLNYINMHAFHYVKYYNVYFKSIPESGSSPFAYTEGLFMFFPYNLVASAKVTTNWTYYASRMYGYSEENTFNVGDALPSIDSEGYQLTWYSDSTLTTQVTTVSDPTQIYYCTVGNRIAVPLKISEYQASCILTDGTNTYTNGDLVPIGDTLTITATGDAGYTTPYIFTLNGTTITSGDTYTATSTPIEIACVYYDGVNAPFEATFSANTPAQIKTAVDSGLHRALWTIGDTKTVTLSDSSTVDIRYIDQQANRYEKSNNEGHTNAVFEFTTLPMQTRMNTSDTNAGGWPASQMNTTTMSTVYSLLPSDWQSVLSECKIPSSGGYSSPSIVYANNKVFIASGQEMYGDTYTNSYYYNEGCTKFDYYRINSANSYKIKQYNNTNTGYWLRSPSARETDRFSYVGPDGTGYTVLARNSAGVSVTFAI